MPPKRRNPVLRTGFRMYLAGYYGDSNSTPASAASLTHKCLLPQFGAMVNPTKSSGLINQRHPKRELERLSATDE